MLNAISILIRSRLCQQALAVVVLSVLVIELLILIPSYWREEIRLIEAVKEEIRYAVLNAEHEYHNYGGMDHRRTKLRKMAEHISHHKRVMGVAYESSSGTRLVEVGEHIPRFGSVGSQATSGITRLDGASRIIFIWLPQETGAAHAGGSHIVGVTVDRSYIDAQLTGFVLRIAGLVFLIAAFVAMSTSLYLGYRFVLPMLRIHNKFIENPSGEFLLDLPSRNRSDELGTVIRSFNAKLTELYTIKKNLEQRVEERTAELVRGEKQIRDLIESLPDGMYVQVDGIVTFVNARMLELLNVSDRRELVGRESIKFFHPDDRESILRGRKAVAGDHDSVTTRRMRILRPDGTEFIAETGSLRVRWQSQQGILVVIRDITEQLEAEAEREILERRLQEGQRTKLLGTLAGGIAHEFNNLLQPISGLTELSMDMVAEDTTIAANLQAIQKCAIRAARLVEKIHAFGERQDRKVRPMRLRDSLGEWSEIIRSMLPATISLHFNFDFDDCVVLGDADQLKDMFYHPVSNSLQAMEDGAGEIWIDGRRKTLDRVHVGRFAQIDPGDYAYISIRDTGVGIDEKTIGSIFDPFFTTQNAGMGSGLGLPILQSIATSHGGAVEVTSEPGVGTTVEIYLPLMEQGEYADIRDAV